MIPDVEGADCDFKVGDEIPFYPSCGTLLATATPQCVQKVMIRDQVISGALDLTNPAFPAKILPAFFLEPPVRGYFYECRLRF